MRALYLRPSSAPLTAEEKRENYAASLRRYELHEMKASRPELDIESEGPDDWPKKQRHLIRVLGRPIETTLADYNDEVRRWLRGFARGHRRRRGPRVVGLSFYRGLPDQFHLPYRWPNRSGRIHLPPRPAPSDPSNPIRALSLCLGGTHCLIFAPCPDPYCASDSRSALQMFLGDRRISVVGVGMASAARKIEAEMGIKIANPLDLRDLAAEAYGREKVFEMKKKGRALAMTALGLPGLAELVLDGKKKKKEEVARAGEEEYFSGTWLKMDGLMYEKLPELNFRGKKELVKKPAILEDAFWCGVDLEEDQILYATLDAFLSFEMGIKCLEMTGRPT